MNHNLLHNLSPSSRLPTDVIFDVFPSSSSPVQIHAHKCFLADGSDVFDKMFYQDGAPKEAADKVIVCVENIEEEIFRKFLNHIYGEKVVVDELIGYESVMEMLVLVEKYNIKDMKEALLLRMKSQVVDEKTSWEL